METIFDYNEETEFRNLKYLAKRALYKHGKTFDEGALIVKYEIERLKRQGEFIRAEGMIRYVNGRPTYMIEDWNAATWLISQKNSYWKNRLKPEQEKTLRRLGLSLERKKVPSTFIYEMVLTEATINPDFDFYKIMDGAYDEYYLDGIDLVSWYKRKQSEAKSKLVSPERKEAFAKFLQDLDEIKNGIAADFGANLIIDQKAILSDAETDIAKPEQKQGSDLTDECLRAISYYMVRNPLQTLESFAQKDEMYGDVNLSKWLRDKMSDFYSGKMSKEEAERFAFLQDEGDDYDPIAHDLGDDYEL